MSNPSPLTAVLIGSDESASQQLRWEAGRRSVAFRYEYATVRQALDQLQVDPAERVLFFCEVRNAAELAELERLSNAFPGRPIAAVFTDEHDDRAVVEAMRAGAAQVVPHPLDRDDLAAAINRLRIQFGDTSSAARTVIVCGVHGGVGATTVTLNLAQALTSGQAPLRCLVCEGVRSAGTVSCYLGLNPAYTVRDVLDISDRLDAELLRKSLTEMAPNLYLLPAPREGMPRIATDEEYALFERLLPQIADVAVGNIDYRNDEAILSRVVGADHCVLMASHSVPSLEALKAVSERCAALSDSRPTLVVGKFDPANKELSVPFMEKLLGGPVHTIRKDPAAAAAANKGTFLAAVASDSPALQDIRALAHTVLNLRVQPQPKRGHLNALLEWLRT